MLVFCNKAQNFHLLTCKDKNITLKDSPNLKVLVQEPGNITCSGR